ncbi:MULTISPECIES: DegT/DnrJ/EryC1/StrS family aminotransferase [Bacillus]|uniref:DegT/DnrJ/EryC1/StrS family aminotransferase n=1 Tax=Bacillus TaxID=1386 RepID=UPI000BEF515B|nr:DegT/DnrJ/EryC1/StrS aminotransferase family protein [Bacillus wiedmannii]PEM24432.1 DegT/DnrJ/EryC1/StrS aminotransferase [Bacillus wiedmannii]PFM45770.1 DegT/DnrJ/EryC1/StrS aminotransferase [Bacillus cereus]
MKVDFYKHSLDDRDIDNVVNTLKSPFLTTGEVVRLFEKKICHIFNVKYAVACNSWTNMGHLVLKSWGIGPGDEVIVPPITFASTATIVSMLGATPIFCDVEEDTGLMNLNLVKGLINKKTKAIIPVHLYGNIVNISALREIINKTHPNIKILEDAAHSFESKRNNQRVGYGSDAAIFSFYATKNLTCGEGGALVTNDEELAEYCRIGTMAGTTKSAFERLINNRYEHYEVVQLSGKYNMTNISASLLIDQIDRLPNLLQKRKKVYNLYLKYLHETNNIQIPKISKGVESAHHLFVILLQPNIREKVLDDLAKLQIGVAINFKAVHQLKVFKDLYDYPLGMLPVSEDWGERCISLPFHASLTEEEIIYITNYFNNDYQKYFI